MEKRCAIWTFVAGYAFAGGVVACMPQGVAAQELLREYKLPNGEIMHAASPDPVSGPLFLRSNQRDKAAHLSQDAHNLCKSAHWPEAAEKFQKLAETEPSAPVFYNLALALFKSSQLIAAREAIAECLKYDEQNEAYLELQSRIEDAVGKGRSFTARIPPIAERSEVASLPSPLPKSNAVQPAPAAAPADVQSFLSQLSGASTPATAPEPIKSITQSLASEPAETPSPNTDAIVTTSLPIVGFAPVSALGAPSSLTPSTAASTLGGVSPLATMAPSATTESNIMQRLVSQPTLSQSNLQPQAFDAPSSRIQLRGIPSFNDVVRALENLDTVANEDAGPGQPAGGFPGAGNKQKWLKAVKFYNRGNLLRHRGRIQEAVDQYVQSIAIYPYDPDCFHNLALSYKQLRQFELAEKAYKDALALRSDSWDTWFNYGNLLIEQGRNKDAETAMDQALKCHPPGSYEPDIQSCIAMLKQQQKPF